MRVGTDWTYNVRAGFLNFVVPVKVTEAVAVGPAAGFRLEGPLGTSEWAWHNKRLIASRLANAEYVPPIPMVVDGFVPQPKEKNSTDDDPAFVAANWSGEVRTLGNSRPATAVLSQRPVKFEYQGRRLDVTLAQLKVTVGKSVIETKTWFQPGKGILQQEQRTKKDEKSGEILVVALELIGTREK